MFQYAFAKSLEVRYDGEKLKLDTRYYARNNIHSGYELVKVFNIQEQYYTTTTPVFDLLRKVYIKQGLLRKKPILISGKEVHEVSLGFFPICLNTAKPFKYYDGYWQSEKYFCNVYEEIRKAFVFPALKRKENIQIRENIGNTNSISLHVRRGDYLSAGHYTCLGKTDYYNKAIHYIKENVSNPVFYVFSDDIEWCQNNLELPVDSVFVNWNTGENSFRDMQLMSLCKHNIIANSSFSWWGAWLNGNPDKKVVAPYHFYRKGSGYDDSHLVPENWHKIVYESVENKNK